MGVRLSIGLTLARTDRSSLAKVADSQSKASTLGGMGKRNEERVQLARTDDTSQIRHCTGGDAPGHAPDVAAMDEATLSRRSLEVSSPR